MSINRFNVGRDITLTVVTVNGPLSMTLITAFQSKQDTQEQKIKGLDGITRHVRFFDGWSGRFNLERRDRTLDDYFNGLETDYYAGIDETEVTITETITEADGSVSQYRYREVLLKMEDAGEWRGDNTVKQTISFIASRRMTIS
jgi:hypothetical protein